MEFVKNISATFWSEKFWLPPGYKWRDIEPGSHGINHADYRHLIYPIPIALVMICIRIAAERFYFHPLGKSLGIKSNRGIPPQPNQPLEAAYRKSKKLKPESLVMLSKQLDLTERDIERWWRRRRSQDKPTTLEKFCENSWKCVFYAFNFCFGLYVLWDKPFLWNILECAFGYPHHEVTNDIWFYYMGSMAFYWQLAVMQFVDNKRKDFWQMFAHHVLALLLISFGWVCNIHRAATLTMVLHDCADIFVEAAKALSYAKMRRTCDIVFGLFTIVWIVTRLIMFPRIIYACIFQTMQPFFPAYFFFNALLVGLLCLHIFWTVLIFKVIAKSVESGEVDDVRSSVESESDDEVVDMNGNIVAHGEPCKGG